MCYARMSEVSDEAGDTWSTFVADNGDLVLARHAATFRVNQAREDLDRIDAELTLLYGTEELLNCADEPDRDSIDTTVERIRTLEASRAKCLDAIAGATNEQYRFHPITLEAL
jgi:hypothetical protein